AQAVLEDGGGRVKEEDGHLDDGRVEEDHDGVDHDVDREDREVAGEAEAAAVGAAEEAEAPGAEAQGDDRDDLEDTREQRERDHLLVKAEDLEGGLGETPTTGDAFEHEDLTPLGGGDSWPADIRLAGNVGCGRKAQPAGDGQAFLRRRGPPAGARPAWGQRASRRAAASKAVSSRAATAPTRQPPTNPNAAASSEKR